MSETSPDQYYQLKKVGKYWMIGSTGKRFRKCPMLTNAKEVDLSDNFLIADDVIYEIQEDETGEVILVKVDDTPVYYKQPHLDDDLESANLQRDITQKLSGQPIETTSKKEDSDKTSKKVDELEMGQTEDDYYSLDAGHTEETSLIEQISAEDIAGTSKVDSSVSGTQGPSIHIVEGSLDREKADALACTVSPSLDLRLGAVSDALLQRGGQKLQSDLNFKCPNYLPSGEIVTVSGHRLDCKVVLFGVMYAYDKEFARKYRTTEEYYRSSVQEFVQRCLKKAEKEKLRSIAFPAIGAGVLGYPVETVADQMFETVSYWRGEHVKEVRFVIYPSDTKVLKAFKSAEKRHADGSTAMSKKEDLQTASKSGEKRNAQKPYQTNTKASGLVVYPYCHRDYPPGQKYKEFACCFGPGQNLYIYSGDILSLTGIDIIACGILKNGKTKGYLANALLEKGGIAYITEVNKQFKTNAASGSVVVCASGDVTNYKWVAHSILFDMKQCKDEAHREYIVTRSFHSIFHTLKEKHCHSIALPLVGTGKGYADPVYYAQRFVDGLHEFCSFNPSYRFQVHLVHQQKHSTQRAIETIDRAILDSRPLSVRTKPQNFSSSKYVAARPESAGMPQSHVKHDQTCYDRHRPESKSYHFSYMSM